jgi:hypothetical protein
MMDFKVLWPTAVHEEKVLILYSDAAAYMLKAANASLKVCYPHLIHFICLVHGLQHIAEEVRAKIPHVNKLILMKKRCF